MAEIMIGDDGYDGKLLNLIIDGVSVKILRHFERAPSCGFPGKLSVVSTPSPTMMTSRPRCPRSRGGGSRGPCCTFFELRSLCAFTPLSINFFSVQWVHSSSVFCVLSVWRSLRSISVGPSLLPSQVASAKDGLNADICYTSLLLTMLAPLGTLNLIASNLAWASLVSLWDLDGRYF